MEPVATFLGKPLYVYDPQLECTEKDFQEYSRPFNLLETLRDICHISSQMFPFSGRLPKLGNVPIRQDVLLELAYRVIKYCDQVSGRGMNPNELEYALRMCHKLSDSEMKYENNVELLIRIAYQQFVFQEKQLNAFARSYYLYTDIWKRTPNTDSIDILAEIESTIGISYDAALLFGYALMGNNEGHFWLYDTKTIQSIGERTSLRLTVEDHKKFLEWCSGDYKTILDEASLLPPFRLHPIVKTNSKPVEGRDEVFMLISKQYMHDKLTSGLYFNLMDRFNKGGSKNQFKQGFGKAFQMYVGELLRFYFKTWEVVPEIRYRKRKHESQDTVDWFLHKDDKLVMIEVKQSSIYSKTKYNPTIKGLKADLQNTIVQSRNQLKVSELDIMSGKYKELRRFTGVKTFLKLIVVNDAFYISNFVMKSIASEGDKFDYQIINISDLEVLLSNQGAAESLFDILYYKLHDDPEMDFKEYITKMFPGATSSVKFLEAIWDGFFKGINVGSIPHGTG